MKTIIKTLDFINSYGHSHHVQLEHSLSKSPQMQRLYEGISTRAIKTDEEAMEVLYMNKGSKSKLSELKRRFLSKILDCIFIISTDQKWNYDLLVAFFKSLKLLYAGRIISATYQASELVIDLYERIYPLAKKYELTEIGVPLCQRLVDMYSLSFPNYKKYMFYVEELKLFNRINQAEICAQLAYSTLIMEHQVKQGPIDIVKLSLLRRKFDNELHEFSDVNSRHFVRLSYLYRIIYAELITDHEKAYELCNQAKKHLNSRVYNAKGAVLSFNIRSLSNLIKIGNYSKGMLLAANCNLDLDQSDEKWYILNFYYFILLCHNKDYDRACQLSENVVKTKKLRGSSSHIRELWLINNAYSNILMNTSQLKTNNHSSTKPYNQFKLYKFLNDVPLHSKDKRGMNISILIVHVLFLIKQNKYNTADDRITSLKAYTKKYLYDDATFRSSCFIHMLVALAGADFHPIRGARHAEKYHKKLLEVPLSKSRQGVEVEIVPYEHLWEMIIDMCNSNLNAERKTITA